MKIDKELTKLYYTIGEVCEFFNVSPSLIRHWESTFSELHSRRSKKGDRRFTVKDIQHIEKIYTLVKERGFTLEGAKKELKKKVGSNALVKEKLSKIKEGLIALKKDL